MADPLVSVVMAVHNGGQFLREAVDSILGQTFKDFEFILMDDGSTDSTPSLLAEYQNADARIRVKRFDQNQGLTHCLNAGIQMARGKYLARMDADDISLPQRFERQVRYLDEHPQVAALGCGFTLMDEAGTPLKDYIFSSRPEVLRWNLLFFNPISHPGAMIRSSIMRELGGYDPQLMRAQDYDLWWRMSFIGRLGNLQDILLLLRQHGGRVTNKHQDQQTDSARSIRKKYLTIALGRDVPESVLDTIKGKRTTARSAAMAGAVILDYCHYCLKGAARPAKLVIMGQALDKTFRQMARFIIYPVTWKIWIRLMFLFIRFLMDKIGSGFSSPGEDKHGWVV
jgi:glycosyltransferase involved in cell wall biosynthesis